MLIPVEPHLLEAVEVLAQFEHKFSPRCSRHIETGRKLHKNIDIKVCLWISKHKVDRFGLEFEEERQGE